MYCPLCKITVADGLGHACTQTANQAVRSPLANPLDPLNASCEIESLRQKLDAKNLEVRLLHTAIDKSNEALEEAVKVKEERDSLLLQNRALEARIEILSRKPLDTGLDNEAWRDGEHCVCNFDPNSHRVRKVCQFHETIYKEWAQAKDKVEATDRLNGEYFDALEWAWSIIASAGPQGCVGNWPKMDKGWVEAAEKWRDRWHGFLRQRSEKRVDPSPKVEYQKFARMAQWRLGVWRLEREDEDGRFCLYNAKDGHSPTFDDAALQQLGELLRNVVVKL